VGHDSHPPTDAILVYFSVLFFASGDIVVISIVRTVPSALTAYASLTADETPEAFTRVPSLIKVRSAHSDVIAMVPP
jgi:hypothetical protein